MAEQSKNPDIDLIVKNVREIAGLGKAFFNGLIEGAEEIKKATNVDSTWADATDTLDDTPAAKDTEPDKFDEYLMTLETRINAYLRAGNMHAAGALRKVVNELTELLDKTS